MTKKDDWYTDNSVSLNEEDVPRPLGWRLVVRPLPPNAKTAGGILLPDSSVEEEEMLQTIGQIVAVGNLCWTRPDMQPDGEFKPWAKVGDYVTYGRYTGKKFQCNGVKLLIMNDDEILTVVDDPVSVRL